MPMPKQAEKTVVVDEAPLRQPPTTTDENGKSVPVASEKLVLADPGHEDVHAVPRRQRCPLDRRGREKPQAESEGRGPFRGGGEAARLQAQPSQGGLPEAIGDSAEVCFEPCRSGIKA